jgi:hypothetical protein
MEFFASDSAFLLSWRLRLGEAATQLASLPGGRPLAAAVFEADAVPIDEGIWAGNLVEECAVYGRDESSDVASCYGRVVQSQLKLYFLTFVTETTYILQALL